MLSATLVIAVNVFRESVRDKVLYNLVAFAILLIAASYVLGQLTAGQDVKIIKDLGLAATSMFGLFIVGHFSTDLRHFDQVVDSAAAARMARALYWILPNLAQFDIKSQVVHGMGVPAGYLIDTIGYAVLYIGMLLSISM